MKSTYLFTTFIIIGMLSLGCEYTKKHDYLLRTVKGDFNEIGAENGYVNSSGEMVIDYGKYYHCVTDTFRNFAIVYTKSGKIVGIDRGEHELYEVFVYDNGPDPLSDGLFRIVKDGKIGYADRNGSIVIEPIYQCAFPFKEGIAKVSKDCNQLQDGEHYQWESKQWIFINKKGKEITTAN
ncbi:WG repeat-containing protein [Plebeiibacterium sediminum]|uniref:WG repeat-containing protein n=1 Tax=Plebeiibacterium sediminum TaxID=2992112 RepID=A0AAE3M8H4_9BACT|nr:WG repeat-containing protein [Plebeiobacterium sediminum]MCW3788917.1 WG repeat-containing protein [Plebeiobacterium sediminum]